MCKKWIWKKYKNPTIRVELLQADLQICWFCRYDVFFQKIWKFARNSSTSQQIDPIIFFCQKNVLCFFFQKTWFFWSVTCFRPSDNCFGRIWKTSEICNLHMITTRWVLIRIIWLYVFWYVELQFTIFNLSHGQRKVINMSDPYVKNMKKHEKTWKNIEKHEKTWKKY